MEGHFERKGGHFEGMGQLVKALASLGSLFFSQHSEDGNIGTQEFMVFAPHPRNASPQYDPFDTEAGGPSTAADQALQEHLQILA